MSSGVESKPSGFLRRDLREWDQSRSLAISLGRVVEVDGAAQFSSGQTAALATVSGPGRSRYSRFSVADRCSLNVEVNIASASQTRGSKSLESGSARQFGTFLQNALTPILHLERFPRQLLSINVLIMRDEGAALAVALNACVLALLDAGFPMKRVVVGVEVALMSSVVMTTGETQVPMVVDPSVEEGADAETLVIAAVCPSPAVWKLVNPDAGLKGGVIDAGVSEESKAHSTLIMNCEVLGQPVTGERLDSLLLVAENQAQKLAATMREALARKSSTNILA